MDSKLVADNFVIRPLPSPTGEMLVMCTCRNCGFGFRCDLRAARVEDRLDEHVKACPNQPLTQSAVKAATLQG